MTTFLIIIASIMLHEIGHMVAFRAMGIPVTKVALGFGPRLIWHKDRCGTEWSFRPILLGGYCAIPEHYWESQQWHPASKAICFVAGPAANLLISSLALVGHSLFGTELLRQTAYWNAALAILNLLPFAPLDGGKLAFAWLQWRNGWAWLKVHEDALGVSSFLMFIGVMLLANCSGWHVVPRGALILSLKP